MYSVLDLTSSDPRSQTSDSEEWSFQELVKSASATKSDEADSEEDDDSADSIDLAYYRTSKQLPSIPPKKPQRSATEASGLTKSSSIPCKSTAPNASVNLARLSDPALPTILHSGTSGDVLTQGWESDTKVSLDFSAKNLDWSTAKEIAVDSWPKISVVKR